MAKPAPLVWLLVLSALLALPVMAQTGAPPAPAPSPIDPATAPLQPPLQPGPPPLGQPGAPGVAGGDDIRDVRTIELEPPPDWLLWGSLAGGGLVLLVALAVYLFMRGRKPRLLPHERALLGLEAARAEVRPGEGRAYAYTVSEIVRVYIEERFNATTAHSTTEEFLNGLVENPNGSLAGYTDQLQDFLTGCDLVKFAGMQLDQGGIDQFHGTALNFVRATAPKKGGQTEASEAPVADAGEAPLASPAAEAATSLDRDGAPEQAALSSLPTAPEPAPAPEPEPPPVAPEQADDTNDSDEHPDSKYLPQ